MNSTGNKNSGYLVALLLVVGLAAFSNSMRELAEIHQFTLDTGRLIAQHIAPAEIPQVVVAKLESCDSNQAVPSVEVAQLTVPAPPVKVERVAPRVRVTPTAAQLAKVDKFRQLKFHPVPFDFNSKQFEFKVAADDDSDVTVQLPLMTSKAKNRKPNVIKFNTRDREMILRTLNRSINLRTAS